MRDAETASSAGSSASRRIGAKKSLSVDDAHSAPTELRRGRAAARLAREVTDSTRDQQRPPREAASSHALSTEQIAHFVENGYLLLRGCFAAEDARRLVEDTLVRRDPVPRYRDLEAHHGVPMEELDLTDPSTWQRPRLYVDTGRSLTIADFAPKLWGAIVSLMGGAAGVGRRTMGEQLILNGDYAASPQPPLDARYSRTLKWHIDTISTRSVLQGRRDALILLALWSDVEPGGGGPVFSASSLDGVVATFEAKPAGFDSTGADWAWRIVSGCSDVAELAGSAGDVLITHGLVLHAAQSNHSTVLRVLENPTITSRRPLSYSADNPAPTPVEECVIRRLRARPATPRARVDLPGAAKLLCELHPGYFLPTPRRWDESVDSEVRGLVAALDSALFREWAQRMSAAVRELNSSHPGRVEACVAICRELFVDPLSVRGHLSESVTDQGFEGSALSRLLRGFASREAQNYVLAQLLEEQCERVELMVTPDPETGGGDHLLVRVVTEEGWCFADAWAPSTVFYVEGAGPRGVAALPGTPEYGELPVQGHHPKLGVLPREVYLHGKPCHAPEETTPPPRAVGDLLRKLRALGPTPTPSPAWSAYLEARLLHLFGGGSAIAEGYRGVLERHRVGGVTRLVVEVLLGHTREGSVVPAI